MFKLPNDVYCSSIMNSGDPNLQSLIELIESTMCGIIDDFKISDICVITKPCDIKDVVTFNVGDIYFKYRDKQNNEYKGCITTAQDTGYKKIMSFVEDTYFLIPNCVFSACSPNISHSQAIERFKKAAEELSHVASHDDALWKEYCQSIVDEEMAKSPENIDKIKKSDALNNVINKNYGPSVTIPLPIDKIGGGKQVIDGKFYLN